MGHSSFTKSEGTLQQNIIQRKSFQVWNHKCLQHATLRIHIGITCDLSPISIVDKNPHYITQDTIYVIIRHYRRRNWYDHPSLSKTWGAQLRVWSVLHWQSGPDIISNLWSQWQPYTHKTVKASLNIYSSSNLFYRVKTHRHTNHMQTIMVKVYRR